MEFRDLVQVLRTPLSVKRVSVAAGPFLSLEFEREEVLGLEELQLRTERMLRMQFIERRVMWEDIRKEFPEPSIDSLQGAALELDEEIREMTKSRPPIGPGLIRLLGHWRTGCVLTKRFLEDRVREATELNRTAFHQDEFIRPRDEAFMPAALVVLRERAYPVIRALLDTLPEKNATRVEGMATFLAGRAFLSEPEKEALTPQWKVEYE